MRTSQIDSVLGLNGDEDALGREETGRWENIIYVAVNVSETKYC